MPYCGYLHYTLGMHEGEGGEGERGILLVHNLGRTVLFQCMPTQLWRLGVSVSLRSIVAASFCTLGHPDDYQKEAVCHQRHI